MEVSLYQLIGGTVLGGGVLLGGLCSLLFFKRRKWPVILGGGFGVGMAYSNCERDINATLQPACESKCERR